ncbi:MAG: hypothetical protein D6815_12310, partial [Candidatus Dadabacteria bacterium]
MRDPAIDRLKGLAILFVFLIHAEPLRGLAVHLYLVDRAVPIFIVLFGVTSRRWWAQHEALATGRRARLWYQRRVRRLVPAPWAVLTAWWGLSAILPGFPEATVTRVGVSFLGYAPWLGMFW